MLFVSLVAVVAAVGVSTAAAGTPVEVSLVGCYFGGGGNATVPAGSDVTVRFGWGESNRGRVQDFLSAQTAAADINGVPIAGASSLWGPIQNNVTFWRTFAGSLNNAGDSVTVHMQITLSHVVSEGKDPDTGEHLKAGPGAILPADFGCTITAT
jgi:hypothetical protein